MIKGGNLRVREEETEESERIERKRKKKNSISGKR
jgi:hypothetical protein